MLADLRYAGRELRRRPGFALTAILSLALGIGATSAVFSVIHGVLSRPQLAGGQILYFNIPKATEGKKRLPDVKYKM